METKAENARIVPQDILSDVERALVDVEFDKTGARLKVAEVGEEVTKTESTMRVAGIERGKDNVGHGRRITRFAERIERTIANTRPSGRLAGRGVARKELLNVIRMSCMSQVRAMKSVLITDPVVDFAQVPRRLAGVSVKASARPFSVADSTSHSSFPMLSRRLLPISQLAKERQRGHNSRRFATALTQRNIPNPVSNPDTFRKSKFPVIDD